MAGVYLSELRLVGIGKESASIKFEKGANIVSGPSNTGKTFIFECIEYMLGGSSIDRRIKESRGYQEIYLELEDDAGDIFTIKSDFEGGDFQKFESPINSIVVGDEYEVLKREHSPGKKNTLSYCILKRCNFNGALVRTNADGKKRELSLRDLRILHLVDELRVPTKGSPFLTGQYTQPTVEENVLKLILTGVDDSHILESIPDKVLANKAGRLEVLNEMIGIEKLNLKDAPPHAEAVEQELKLNSSIAKAKQRRDSVVDSYDGLNDEREDLLSNIYQASVRKKELSKLYENTFVLEKQYLSDINRLRSTIEVGSALANIGKSNCPLCDSLIGGDLKESVIDVSVSAQAELSKMDGLMLELSKAKALFKFDIDEFSRAEELNAEALRYLNLRIESEVKIQMERFSSEVDELQEKLQEVSMVINGCERLEYLLSQRDQVESAISNAPPKKRSFEKLPSSAMEKISLNMEAFLRDWGYPDISRVTYSEDSKDFIISGENRNLAGKGYRAISFASFIFSLVKFSMDSDKKLGFCLIDSPLVTYKKPEVPDGEGISEDMAAKFYESLAHVSKKSQIIIIENEDVPESLDGLVNHIHFTKNPKIGRYGFIPLEK